MTVRGGLDRRVLLLAHGEIGPFGALAALVHLAICPRCRAQFHTLFRTSRVLARAIGPAGDFALIARQRRFMRIAILGTVALLGAAVGLISFAARPASDPDSPVAAAESCHSR